jgi:hypothetical protein
MRAHLQTSIVFVAETALVALCIAAAIAVRLAPIRLTTAID